MIKLIIKLIKFNFMEKDPLFLVGWHYFLDGKYTLYQFVMFARRHGFKLF